MHWGVNAQGLGNSLPNTRTVGFTEILRSGSNNLII
jgi:hypothetical protein